MSKKVTVPDGGYGWVVVAAQSIYYAIIFSTIANFGLIYQAKIKELKLPATDVSLIINVNNSFGMASGLIAAPLIKRFGARKIGLLGSSCLILGMSLSYFAYNFSTFLISFGFIAGLSYGIGCTSFLVSVSSYFIVNRSRAIAIAMAFAAIGPIVYPMIISYLLSQYSAQDCIGIMVAISGHTIVAALLLQPVKWHFCKNTDENQKFTDTNKSNNVLTETATISINKTSTQINNFETSIKLPTIKNVQKSFGQKIIDLFDLNILKDKTCANVILGLSCADFAEFNFMAITPLILIDMNYKTRDVASIMSIMAIADVVLRFLSPTIEHFFQQKPRSMLLYSLVIFVFARLALIYSWSYTTTSLAAIIVGIARGITNVYWNVVISNTVPIERLPSAVGLQMVTGSILLVTMGFLVGLLRDIYESYTPSLIFLNIFSTITIVTWSFEMIFQSNRKIFV